jgi:hypothetical protein
VASKMPPSAGDIGLLGCKSSRFLRV